MAVAMWRLFPRSAPGRTMGGVDYSTLEASSPRKTTLEGRAALPLLLIRQVLAERWWRWR